ncbi:MAG: chemotaxis protein CheW [Methanoregulaceae archaeon]|nr:chemotaxis protein CheW [Methanoregulaceae archaeon]
MKTGAGNISGPGARTIADSVQVVEFILGKEHFAIDLFDVKEVVEYTQITQLPNAPIYVKGMISLRSEITTIIDLKVQMHIKETQTFSEENSKFIVLDEKITRSKVGIMVDDVLAVSTFSRNQVDTTTSFGSGDGSIIGTINKKIGGKEKDGSDLVIWIDIKRILKDL